MDRTFTKILMCWFAVTSLAAILLLVIATPNANAGSCTGTWSIVVGGMTIDNASTIQSSGYLIGDHRVTHNSIDTADGTRALDAAFWNHRTQCPADHIKLVGHSEGALVVDLWASQAGASDVSVVLLARPGGGFLTPGALSICRTNDSVCNPGTDAIGYLTGAHTAYDFNANDYSDDGSGMVWLPAT